MNITPIPFRRGVEDVKPGEAQTVEQLCQMFDSILKTTAKDHGRSVRSVHAKARSILDGTLTVDERRPPELAQGLFVTPGEHKFYMRLSTNAGAILPRVVSLLRRLAFMASSWSTRVFLAKPLSQASVALSGASFVFTSSKMFPTDALAARSLSETGGA